MELVRGVRHDEYCNQQQLTTRQRVELFIGVCEAVQHAHQKGVIHRDLKPSNVLVTEESGRPTPKIIDFGIAKATGQKLTQETVVTTYGQALGTLAYMSPEQAEMSGLDVDTRTDVYSLGVTLYELLAGAIPLDPNHVGAPAFVAQLIQRDQTMPTLSQRLAGLTKQQLAQRATQHGTESGSLKKELTGDLQWIIQKAIEKDRARRYETANGLAMDLKHYLADEPIMARPPSAAYRAGKFTRRHKLGVTFAATLAVLLVGVAVNQTIQADRIALARDEAEAQRVRAENEAEAARQTTDFLVELFEVSDPSEARGNSITAREVLDRGARRIEFLLGDQPAIQADLMDAIGTVYRSLGLYAESRALLEQVLTTRRTLYGSNHVQVARSKSNLAQVMGLQAEFEEAKQLYEEAIRTLRASPDADEGDVALSVFGLAVVHTLEGDFEAADSRLRQAIELQRGGTNARSLDLARSLDELGMNLAYQGQYEEAEPLVREALAIRRDLIPSGIHPDLEESLNNLGVFLYQRDGYEEAEQLFREALSMKLQLVDEGHPDVATVMNNLAMTLHDRGLYEEAEAYYAQALAIRVTSLGESHPAVASSLNNLSFVYNDLGRTGQALEYSRRALEVYRNAYEGDHPDIAIGLTNLANRLVDNGDHAAAESMLTEALAMTLRIFPGNHPDVALTRIAMAKFLLETERPERAVELATAANESLTEAVGDDHRWTARARSVQGMALVALGQFARAEPLVVRAYETLRTSGGSPESVRSALRGVADLYLAWGRPEEAEPYQALIGVPERR